MVPFRTDSDPKSYPFSEELLVISSDASVPLPVAPATEPIRGVIENVFGAKIDRTDRVKVTMHRQISKFCGR